MTYDLSRMWIIDAVAAIIPKRIASSFSTTTLIGSVIKTLLTFCSKAKIK